MNQLNLFRRKRYVGYFGYSGPDKKLTAKFRRFDFNSKDKCVAVFYDSGMRMQTYATRSTCTQWLLKADLFGFTDDDVKQIEDVIKSWPAGL